MMKNNIILLVVFGLLFFSCEEFLQPEDDNLLTEDQVLSVPKLAERTLLKAYMLLPDGDDLDLAIASDNAVSNDKNSKITAMATGSWSQSNNPIAKWKNAYDAIFYCNLFLSQVDEVEWSWESEAQNEFYKKRLKAEAYGLRAYYEFQLLQYHAGVGENGELLGFPIIDKVITSNDNWELPRDSYADCYAQIKSDCEKALEGLPMQWIDLDEDEYLEVIHPGMTIDEDEDENGDDIFVVLDESTDPATTVKIYSEEEAELITFNFNHTMGERNINRMNGMAVRALLSRAALHAASPAFNASGVTWEEAATIAGDLIAEFEILDDVDDDDLEFYLDEEAEDIIWNNAYVENNNIEKDNYPPSVFGSGKTNPTQDLVDAFPMENGYPITHAESGYDPANPYEDRDPRLELYILFNGTDINGSDINTFVGAEKDGINQLNSSTRTGYYLKKLLHVDKVSLIPGQTSNDIKFYTYFRKTEVLLNFAEAANQAWGPTGDPNGYGFNAQTVMTELRDRADIDDPEVYIQTLDKNGLTELIKTDRRIELCFEGQRFWDIRRWNDLETMKASVKGVKISEDLSSYEYFTVEDRLYQDHMVYGPIPYEETLKYGIVQNKNW